MDRQLNTITSNSELFDHILRDFDFKGRKLYNSNPIYRDLATVMEHPEFKMFYDKYLSNRQNFGVIMLFLKLYNDITEEVNDELNGYQKLYMMSELLKNVELRHNLVEEILQFVDQTLYIDKK